MARPEIEPKEQRAFAMSFLEQIYGGKLPDFVDPVKNIKKQIGSLPKDEKKFWVKTILHPSSFVSKPLKSRLAQAIRSWVYPYEKINGCPFEYCGFSFEELKEHIENQFEPWMSWENWGQWHIDHIIPRSLYGERFTKSEIFGIQNLQPICAKDNIRKGNKYEPTT